MGLLMNEQQHKIAWLKRNVKIFRYWDIYPGEMALCANFCLEQKLFHGVYPGEMALCANFCLEQKLFHGVKILG